MVRCLVCESAEHGIEECISARLFILKHQYEKHLLHFTKYMIHSNMNKNDVLLKMRAWLDTKSHRELKIVAYISATRLGTTFSQKLTKKELMNMTIALVYVHCVREVSYTMSSCFQIGYLECIPYVLHNSDKIYQPKELIMKLNHTFSEYYDSQIEQYVCDYFAFCVLCAILVEKIRCPNLQYAIRHFSGELMYGMLTGLKYDANVVDCCELYTLSNMYDSEYGEEFTKFEEKWKRTPPDIVKIEGTCNEYVCEICYQEYSSNSNVIEEKCTVNKFQCGHSMCGKCVWEHMITHGKNGCPFCRTEITTIMESFISGATDKWSD